MDELGVDVLLLSVGADLPYLTGYEAMPLERLTMLVLPREGDARLVVPRLEAPRVVAQPDLFEIVPWEETDDPIELVAELIGSSAASAAIGDTTWARFVLDLQLALPGVAWVRASQVLSEIRMVKDADEIAALLAAAARSTRSRSRCDRVRSPVAPSSTCTASWSSGCSRSATNGRTSRSSPRASTRPARTTSRPPIG